MSGFIKKGGAGSVSVDSIPGLEAWQPDESYPSGWNVKESGRIWESLQDDNEGHIPSADNALAPVWWKEISASHLQNTDSKLKRTNGTFIHADNIATLLAMGFVSFVSKGGSNTTGTMGRMDLPFLTIQAAVNSNANTIVVLGGEYNEQVQILQTASCNRLLLWFGARITSNAAYTIEIGKGSFTIEGQAMLHTTAINLVLDCAIINTHATGITCKLGGNPGAVFPTFHNVVLRSEGANDGAAVFNNFTWTIAATNCKFYAVRTIFKLDNRVLLINCILDSANLLHESDPYSGLAGMLENCKINTVNGFYGLAKGLTFKGGSYRTTTGVGFNLINQSTGLKLKELSLVTQSHCIAGDTGNVEIVNSELQSLAGMVYNASLFYFPNPSLPKMEIRDSKLIAEESQAYTIQNNYASNTKINLINVSMNKPFDANVDGLIHNVLIDDTLTAF